MEDNTVARAIHTTAEPFTGRDREQILVTPSGSDADVNKKQTQATVCNAVQFIPLLIF